MGELIKINVTQATFDENFSIDDWFHFSELTQLELYNIMLKFVVDEDGKPLPVDEARKLFKTVPKKEWIDYVNRFYGAVRDAFVNPTSGGS